MAVYEDDTGKVREEVLPNRHGPNRKPSRGDVTYVKVDPQHLKQERRVRPHRTSAEFAENAGLGCSSCMSTSLSEKGH